MLPNCTMYAFCMAKCLFYTAVANAVHKQTMHKYTFALSYFIVPLYDCPRWPSPAATELVLTTLASSPMCTQKWIEGELQLALYGGGGNGGCTHVCLVGDVCLYVCGAWRLHVTVVAVYTCMVVIVLMSFTGCSGCGIL